MKLKFGLISLFILAAIVAMASSLYVKRQKAIAWHQETLELELAKLEGTWESVLVNDIFEHMPPFTFKDPEIELLRPGVYRFTSPTGEVAFGIYKWNGDGLIHHRTGFWYQCPRGFDEIEPDVSWDAPPDAFHLFGAETRVHRHVLMRGNVDP